MPLEKFDPLQTAALKLDSYPDYTRDEVTIVADADNADLKSGSVMGQITTGGKWTLSDGDAVDGSQVAKGVLLISVVASVAAGDQVAWLLVRGPSIVARDALLWHVNNDAPEITTAEGELLTAGIKVEQTV